MSPTGGPGTPLKLTPPASRVAQSYRGVWHAALVDLPRNLRNVQTVRRALKGLNR